MEKAEKIGTKPSCKYFRSIYDFFILVLNQTTETYLSLTMNFILPQHVGELDIHLH